MVYCYKCLRDENRIVDISKYEKNNEIIKSFASIKSENIYNSVI